MTGAKSGIVAHNTGGGAVSITVNGSVTGSDGDGISASDGTSGAGVTIAVASVTGSDTGIEAFGSGTGAVAVSATGPVTGSGTYGIDARVGASGGAIMVTAAAVTGGKVGIKALSSGTGLVSISASGSVIGTADDGIFVDHNGAGATIIAVSSAVTGGAGAGNAAIRTDVTTGRSVTITLDSGASVGTGTSNAIMGSAGNTAVTVNTGATVTGKGQPGWRSRYADGELRRHDRGQRHARSWSRHADLRRRKLLRCDGDGTVAAVRADMLKFDGGSGSLHATVVSEGLKGWESILVESGATLRGTIRLADSSRDLTLANTDITNITTLIGGDGSANKLSLNDVSGSLNGANVTGWERVNIGAGSVISFGTALTADTLGVTGTLDVGDDSDASDTLTLTGDFLGSGGTVVIDANFAPGLGASDKLVISGTVAGTADVRIDSLGGAAERRAHQRAGENHGRDNSERNPAGRGFGRPRSHPVPLTSAPSSTGFNTTPRTSGSIWFGTSPTSAGRWRGLRARSSAAAPTRSGRSSRSARAMRTRCT